jgi:hypothetical protein
VRDSYKYIVSGYSPLCRQAVASAGPGRGGVADTGHPAAPVARPRVRRRRQGRGVHR